MSNLQMDDATNRILQLLSTQPNLPGFLTADSGRLLALIFTLTALACSPFPHTRLVGLLLCTYFFATIWNNLAFAKNQRVWLLQPLPIESWHLYDLPQGLLVNKIETIDSGIQAAGIKARGDENQCSEKGSFKNAGSDNFVKLYHYIKNWQTSDITKLQLLKYFLLNSNINKSSNKNCGNLQESLVRLTGKFRNIDNIKEDEAFLLELISIVLANISNIDFCPSLLYKQMAMSSSQLHRRIKEVTNMTPGSIIRCCRLTAAKSLLIETDFQISDISFETGFKDPAYFTRLFTHEFKVSPSRFRKKERKTPSSTRQSI